MVYKYALPVVVVCFVAVAVALKPEPVRPEARAAGSDAGHLEASPQPARALQDSDVNDGASRPPTPRSRPRLRTQPGERVVFVFGSIRAAAAYKMAMDEIGRLREAEPSLYGGDRRLAKQMVDEAAFSMLQSFMANYGDHVFSLPDATPVEQVRCFSPDGYPGEGCWVTPTAGPIRSYVFVDETSVTQ